jgi:hypothetical protein
MCIKGMRENVEKVGGELLDLNEREFLILHQALSSAKQSALHRIERGVVVWVVNDLDIAILLAKMDRMAKNIDNAFTS